MRKNQMAKRGLRYGYANMGPTTGTIVLVVVILLWIALQIVSGLILRSIEESKVREKYRSTECSVSGIKIVNASPNVRSEPVNMDCSDYTNTYGKVPVDTKVNIGTLCTTDIVLDANGPYLGLKVKEIIASPGGKDAFPKGIKRDKDGIVWINADYLEIYD